MKDLTVGKERNQILNFAAPMILGQLFQQVYVIIDSIIVGNYLGPDALAAVGTSIPIIFLLISLAVGITNGATILIAQYFGFKDYNKISSAIDTINVFLLIASILISTVGIIFCHDIFLLINLPESIMPLAEKYMTIYFYGLYGMFGFYGIAAILRGAGDSKTPLYFQIFASVLNIVLDIVFVVYLKKGVEGVAYSTIIAQGITFIISVVYLHINNPLIKFKILNLKFDSSVFYQSIRIGIPSGLQQAFVSLGMMAIFRIVNGFGPGVIAAYSIVSRIEMFASMPTMNLSIALSTFIGQNIGAKKMERVKTAFNSTVKISALISVVISMIVIVFANQIMRIFVNDPDVISTGVIYLYTTAPFYLLFGVLFASNGALRGAGDTVIPMFITLFALWGIRIPLAYIFSDLWGVNAIWWGIPTGWAIGMILSLLYYYTGRWKTKVAI